MILMTHRKRTVCYVCHNRCPLKAVAKIIYRFRKSISFDINPAHEYWEEHKKIYEKNYDGRYHRSDR